MARGQKRIVIAVALIAAAVLGVTSYTRWNFLRNEWWRWQAIRDVRKPEFDPSKPSPASWSRIIAAGEAGFPALAKLLHDPDPKVWEYARQICDQGRQARLPPIAMPAAPGGGPPPPSANRPAAPSAGLIQIQVPEDREGQDPFLFYIQQNDSLAAVRFLLPEGDWRSPHSVLLGDSEWFHYWCPPSADHLEPTKEAVDFLESSMLHQRFHNRALGGLAAMLKPGEVNQPGSPLAARIVKILALAGRQDSRVEALRLLAMRSTPPHDDRPRYRIPFQADWTRYSWRESVLYSVADFSCRESLLSLCHYDDIWTLGIISRLMKNPFARPELEAFLDERPRLGPLEMPRWLPLIDAARRLFTVGYLQRAAEGGFIETRERWEGKLLIQGAMSGETDEALIFYHSSCLLVLGDETQRERVQEYFKQHPDEHLARNLLFGGDLATLEWLISNHQSIRIDLGEYIDGLPKDQALLDWWTDNKARIEFDPARRKFFVQP